MAAVAVSPAATDAAGVSSKVSADTKKPVMNGTSSSSASSASSAPAAASAPAPTVAQIFKTLEYGPAPEASDALNAWLDKHNRKFGLFINNQWVFPAGRSLYPSYDPNTGTKIADTLQATKEDIDGAVGVARAAFEKWSTTSPYVRAQLLYSVARHIQKHARLLSVLESLDNGKPIRESRDIDVPLCARHFYYFAGWAQLFPTELSHYKPVGVCAQVIPWNFPMLMLAWKIAPALAMGNTVVLKPASYTRLSALLFCEILTEAGVPPGVVNIVTGPGSIGGYLAEHPDVDKVAFTGSTEVGRTLRQAIAGSGKKLSLELGGKGPIIVFDSADLDSAVEGVVDAIWFNQGQVCCAGSRLLLQESVWDLFIKKLKRRMDSLRVSHCLDKNIDVGALVDQSQVDSISKFVEDARKEGAEIYKANIEMPKKGLYYPPTLITKVSPASTCVIEEIFGPVLVAMSFRHPEEAIALANNTKFGLAGSVWTNNINLALHVAVSVKAGKIWINMHNTFDAAAGFGGYKESGFGREGGKEGLFEYVRPKWQERPKPEIFKDLSERVKKWGTWVPPSPVAVPSVDSITKSVADITNSPTIDRTPKVYIGGKQRRPDATYALPILDRKGKVIGEVPDCNRKDVRDAVEAAHAAAPGWGKRSAYNRAQICYYLAENLSIRAAEFADRIVAQTGCSEAEGEKEVKASIERLFYYAAWADKYGGSIQETPFYGLTAALNEPIGVVAIACPDKNPLLAFISLVIPAVVRANTVVVIASEKFPLCATDLYQVLDTSDLPGGVINILTGNRDHISKTLADHQDVDSMFYFGDALGSACVEYLAGKNMKRTWVSYGVQRDWYSHEHGEGEEFLKESSQVKNVWAPCGE